MNNFLTEIFPSSLSWTLESIISSLQAGRVVSSGGGQDGGGGLGIQQGVVLKEK